MRALLLFLSRKESFKNFLMRFRTFRATAWRFVAGEKIEDAIRVARELNLQGIKTTMDLLGENTLSRADAARATQGILTLVERIHAEKIDGNVSLKLTQLGLDLGREICHQNLMTILRCAAALGIYLRVDMEDSSYTQRTLDAVLRAHKEIPGVGAVIQAYLYRSEKDVRLLIENSIGIRLCKGAYLEPAAVAFQRKQDTDANYIKLMKLILPSGLRHGIATHDENMITTTRQFAAEMRIPGDHVEFQMLYGIRRDLQRQLARQGYGMRVYIPYGTQWYPYFMRRLAERPANLAFLCRNLLRG